MPRITVRLTDGELEDLNRRCPRGSSMGRKGDCFDNAVAETYFAMLKKELIHRRSWPERAELRTEIFDNRRRRHSTLGFLSPAQFEKIHLDQDQKAQLISFR